MKNKDLILDINPIVFNIFSSKDLESIIKKYNLKECYSLTQIHSNIVHIVDDNYQDKTLGDGLITNKKNIALIIKTADCIPILLFDNKNKVLSLVHSGWKGTLNNIVSNAINLMVSNYNSKKENISAYLYPSIRICHFEVEKDVYIKFKNKIPNFDKYVIKKIPKYYIDLNQIIIDNLKELGIKNIIDTNICTYCNHNQFYSYRYNHTDKRNYLIALIKE